MGIEKRFKKQLRQVRRRADTRRDAAEGDLTMENTMLALEFNFALIHTVRELATEVDRLKRKVK